MDTDQILKEIRPSDRVATCSIYITAPGSSERILFTTTTYSLREITGRLRDAVVDQSVAAFLADNNTVVWVLAKAVLENIISIVPD